MRRQNRGSPAWGAAVLCNFTKKCVHSYQFHRDYSGDCTFFVFAYCAKCKKVLCYYQQ